jgi:hypothetical protein
MKTGHAQKPLAGKKLSEKISIQMITLIALSRLIDMKAKQRNQRKEQ